MVDRDKSKGPTKMNRDKNLCPIMIYKIYFGQMIINQDKYMGPIMINRKISWSNNDSKSKYLDPVC